MMNSSPFPNNFHRSSGEFRVLHNLVHMVEQLERGCAEHGGRKADNGLDVEGRRFLLILHDPWLGNQLKHL